MAYNDELYSTLRGEGYDGTLNAMLYNYYFNNGGVGGTLNEREYNWLGAKGFLQPTLNERWYAYLQSLGYTGGIDYMKYLAVRNKTLLSSIYTLSGMAAIWDFSDMATLFQDSAGTTPVTALGQPVGKVLDKKGNGNHLIQPTAPNRPFYALDSNGKPSLSLNGSNQWMQTAANLDLSGTDKLTVVVGVRKLSDATPAMLVELSVNAGPNGGTFYITAPESGANYVFKSAGTSGVTATATGYAAPITSVLSAYSSISGASSTIRANGVDKQTQLASQGAGNYGTYPLYIGARAGTSLFFNGNIHTLCIRGALSTQPEIDLLERFANSRAGAY